jgi:two-component system, chemotaxis family, chemotaxis protein CheY
MKTLVVDDSPAMRMFIRRVLELSGLEADIIAEASNGREALELLQDQRVDLLLCDINMPEMNGEQLLAALAEKGISDRACVVVVSTDSTTTRMERMRRLGARGYLTKPFTPETMRETLDRALSETYA